WVEINPEDAAALGVADGEMVKAKTRRGEIEIGAKVTDGCRKGEGFIPFHYIECAANILTNNALDPVAKIPEFKACAVRIEKLGGA
ncbi:MAG: formate dehydrogenase subunit alpha, partial [Methanomicrobiales archaeon]|nr:formate dehydrogenase subunit alpha [Methanomicrobiales archaeon]